MICYLSLFNDYTLERDGRELQLIAEEGGKVVIIPLREMEGNYNR